MAANQPMCEKLNFLYQNQNVILHSRVPAENAEPPDRSRRSTSSPMSQFSSQEPPNTIHTVQLFDVPIVALNIDRRLRLCLAQISSILLKSFSYNEIHNRRVALGINCVQCTPVKYHRQLKKECREIECRAILSPNYNNEPFWNLDCTVLLYH